MWIVRDPVPGCLHHIIVRFIDRDFLINDDRSRAHYLRLLGRAMSESDWKCFAYAVMSNHLHLAMLAGVAPAERWMRRVHPPFAATLNKCLARIGPLFAGAPAIWVVPPEKELRVIAYIHNNPVRAGLVAHARESTWTSHREYLGGTRSPWLATDAALARLGLTVGELDAAVDANVGYKPEGGDLHRVRQRARTRGALEVATPVGGDLVQVPLVARKWSRFRPTPVYVIEVAADVLGIPVDNIMVRGRATDARAVSLQCGRALGLSLASMAGAMGISAQSGSRLGLRKLDDDDAAAARVIVRRIEGALSDSVQRAVAGNRRRSLAPEGAEGERETG